MPQQNSRAGDQTGQSLQCVGWSLSLGKGPLAQGGQLVEPTAHPGVILPHTPKSSRISGS